MEEKKIFRSIRYLSIYAIISSILILILLVIHILSPGNGYQNKTLVSIDSLKANFIAATRIHVVEANGKLGISLSNSDNSPLPRFDGKILYGANNRESPNIVFFDGNGDEVGGINFSNKNADGPNAVRHLAFDGFKQDEVITLSHFVRNGKTNTGLYIYDRPQMNIMQAFEEMGILPSDDTQTLNEKIKSFKKNNPERHKAIWGSERRVAVQTNDSGQSEVVLQDGNGRPRLRLTVSKDGEALIEFLNDKGHVLHKIGPKCN